MSKQTCILITGAPHSGTRLVLELLNEHPDVDVPMTILNDVREHGPTIQAFVEMVESTPIYQSTYNRDERTMRFFLDSYQQAIDTTKPYFVFKSPMFPLMWTDWFLDYYEGQVKLVYTHRPIDKVSRSFLRDGLQGLIFDKRRNDFFLRWTKFLPPDRRSYYLSTYDSELFAGELVQHFDSLRQKWDQDHPHQKFLVADVEKITKTKESLSEFVASLDLRIDNLDRMYNIIDHTRLHQRNDTQAGTPDTNSPIPQVIRNTIHRFFDS